MFGSTSAYPTYLIVPNEACPYISGLCCKMFSDVLFEGLCPCSCYLCNEASSLPGQLRRHLELSSD